MLMKTIQGHLESLLIAKAVYTEVESEFYTAIARIIPIDEDYSVFVNVNETAMKDVSSSTPITSIVTMVVLNSLFQEKDTRFLPLHVLSRFNEILIYFITNGVLPEGDAELFQKFLKFAEQSHG